MVCVDLVLCPKLFDYKFTLICGDVVLILNLILVIKNKNFPTHRTKPIHVGWVRLEFFFNPPMS